jgi:capsular exopolysaccharide synthesis family protein
LRTLPLQRGGGDKQVILVTSSLPDEGKSMTAMALAEMAALAGKSVLLVDADLRRSRLMKTFGWNPDYDLADFILERADLAEAIMTDDALGIHVLAAAQPCPEAADDLSTDWLRPMMDELKRVYDVVIVDSPPLLKVSDGLVLAQVADSIVYVVRWDETPRSAVAEGLDALAGMNLGVTGIVLNQVDPKVAEKAYGEGYAAYA